MAGQRLHLDVAREAIAAGAALALSMIVVAHVIASDRVALLYTDGDSLITTLVARSLLSGEQQDWAMSSVLFIPEVAVVGLLLLVGLPTMAALTVNGLLNLLALYGAIRFVVGCRGAALVAFAAFAALALLEGTASRESIELASLMATTTYYSSTVIGVLVTVGLLLRRPGSRAWVAALAAIALACTVTNPIYLAWAVVPLVLLLAVAHHLAVRVRLLAAAALVVGCGTGLLLRIPLGPWIANTGVGYAQPSQWEESLQYYGGLVADRLVDGAGVVSVIVWGILLLVGIALTVVGIRRRQPRLAALAAVSWTMPVVVIVGAIALGTHAARYLQPAVFLPVLAVAAAALAVVPPMHRLLLPAAAAVLGVVAVVALPAVTATASQRYPNDDIACVARWVDASERIGAGQFWTVRAPKAYADDPSQLVQVDFQLGAYAWLVNRRDFAPGAVSFLVIDEQSFPFELPSGLDRATAETIECGSYTILDFGESIVPLGVKHS